MSDVDNILWAAFQINNVWILPLQIGVVIYMLYDVIGAAAFAGLGVIGISMAKGGFAGSNRAMDASQVALFHLEIHVLEQRGVFGPSKRAVFSGNHNVLWVITDNVGWVVLVKLEELGHALERDLGLDQLLDHVREVTQQVSDRVEQHDHSEHFWLR